MAPWWQGVDPKIITSNSVDVLNASSPPPGRFASASIFVAPMFYPATNRNQFSDKTSHATGSLYKQTKNKTNFNSFQKNWQIRFKILLTTSLEEKGRLFVAQILIGCLVGFRPMVLSLGICPSGWMPCSKQKSSQQALPIWTPPWAAQLFDDSYLVKSCQTSPIWENPSFVHQHDLARLGIYLQVTSWLTQDGFWIAFLFLLDPFFVLNRTPSSLRFLFFFTPKKWCHVTFIATIFINQNKKPTTSTFFIFLLYLYSHN